jgi:hypothetical protein
VTEEEHMLSILAHAAASIPVTHPIRVLHGAPESSGLRSFSIDGGTCVVKLSRIHLEDGE